MPTQRVALVVPPDFGVVPIGVVLEAFAYPRLTQMRQWYDVRLCGSTPGIQHAAGGWLTATITDGVDSIASADTVIVPQAATDAEQLDPQITEALREACVHGARMVSFGSGAFALAAAGVLDGRRVTTHWRHAQALARAYPRVHVDASVLYIDDGQVLTSGGRLASIDLTMHLLRKDLGVSVANTLSRDVLAYPHREGMDAQVVSSAKFESDDGSGLRLAVRYALEHLDEDLGLAELAALAFMSPRHFTRRFRQHFGTTSIRWLNHQRLVRAGQLLEETNMPVERVAHESGFRSVVTFRQRFVRQYSMSPAAYRKKFRIEAPAPDPGTPQHVTDCAV